MITLLSGDQTNLAMQSDEVNGKQDMLKMTYAENTSRSSKNEDSKLDGDEAGGKGEDEDPPRDNQKALPTRCN